MRNLILIAAAAALLLTSAGAASAVTLTFTPTTPLVVAPGDSVSFDFYLSNVGTPGVDLISLDVVFDPSALNYDAANSDSEDYYPLYAIPVQIGKHSNEPATWLIPGLCSDGKSYCDDRDFEADPPILRAPGVVEIQFIAAAPSRGTTATATNLYLSTVTFVANSSSTVDFGFHSAANAFRLIGEVDIQDQVTIVGGVHEVLIIPEPTSALLVGLGLFALGAIFRA